MQVTKGDRYLCTLGEGKLFGELAILYSVVRTASVRGISTGLCLGERSFMTHLRVFFLSANAVFLYPLIRFMLTCNTQLCAVENAVEKLRS